MTCKQFRLWVGDVAVFTAIRPSDRLACLQHTESCPECEAWLAGPAGQVRQPHPGISAAELAIRDKAALTQGEG